MKLFSRVVILSIIGSSVNVFAQAPTTAPMGGPEKIPQCQAPVAACKTAGFKPGMHKKGDAEGADSGLWMDCIGAVADGKKQVPGVDPSAAQACRTAIKAAKMSK